MGTVEARVKLPDAARRLGITTREALDWIDRGELEFEWDRDESRIYIPASQLPS